MSSHWADQKKTSVLLSFFRNLNSGSSENKKYVWSRHANRWLRLGLRSLHVQRDGSKFTFSNEQKVFFDQGATLYNEVNGKNLETYCNQLESKPNEGLRCIGKYIKANDLLLRGIYEPVKPLLEEAKKCLAFTGKPEFFGILFWSPEARLYYMTDSVNELHDFLVECFTDIFLQGKFCSGSIYGWIFYMKAMLHYMHSNRNDPGKKLVRYKNEIALAIDYMKFALDEFSNATTEDQYFGKAHALPRLAMFNLHCGENASLNESYTVQPSEIAAAKKYLEDLHNLRNETGLGNVVIEILYNMAESDFHFRCKNNINNIAKAAEYAEKAYKLANEHGCNEFIRCTRKRKEVFREKAEKRKMPLTRKRKHSMTHSIGISESAGTSEVSNTVTSSIHADLEPCGDIFLAMGQIQDNLRDTKRRKMVPETTGKVNRATDAKKPYVASTPRYSMVKDDSVDNINFRGAETVQIGDGNVINQTVKIYNTYVNEYPNTRQGFIHKRSRSFHPYQKHSDKQ